MMKNTILILTLFLAAVATQSCKKPPIPAVEEVEENGGNNGGGEEEVEVSPYVGEWDYTKIDLTNGVLEIMGNEVGEFVGTGKDIVGEVIITEKPNRYTTTLEFTAAIELEFGGQGQTQESPVDKQTSSGTWTETNGEITLTDDTGKEVAVLSSTSNRIVFTGEFSTAIPLQFFSIDATSDVVFTIEK